jgi:hypothetical protein
MSARNPKPTSWAEFARLGGKARVAKLTPEELRELARKGGLAKAAKAKQKKEGK